MIQEKDKIEIKGIFMESAKKYYDFYNEGLKKLDGYSNLPPDVKAEYPFLCWNESDLRTYTIHNFLNEVKHTFRDIGFTVHSEFQMKPGKFKHEAASQMWDNAVSEVCKSKGRKRKRWGHRYCYYIFPRRATIYIVCRGQILSLRCRTI